jgi:hypothetical protein
VLLISVAMITILWLTTVTVFLALGVNAARVDVRAASAGQTLPLRSTWRAVRNSSFMSAQSDQVETYR